MPILQDDERTLNTEDWFDADCARQYASQEGNSWNLRHILLEDSGIWIGKQVTASETPSGVDTDHCASSRQDAQIAFQYRDHGTALRSRAEEYRVEFEALSKRWQRETKHLSLVSKKITHPSFLRIVGMGEPVIPLILEALRDRPRHWFAALRATANVDPAPSDATPSEARDAWLAWGQSRGYID